jgi:hypothetical protein
MIIPIWFWYRKSKFSSSSESVMQDGPLDRGVHETMSQWAIFDLLDSAARASGCPERLGTKPSSSVHWGDARTATCCWGVPIVALHRPSPSNIPLAMTNCMTITITITITDSAARTSTTVCPEGRKRRDPVAIDVHAKHHHHRHDRQQCLGMYFNPNEIASDASDAF